MNSNGFPVISRKKTVKQLSKIQNINQSTCYLKRKLLPFVFLCWYWIPFTFSYCVQVWDVLKGKEIRRFEISSTYACWGETFTMSGRREGERETHLHQLNELFPLLNHFTQWIFYRKISSIYFDNALFFPFFSVESPAFPFIIVINSTEGNTIIWKRAFPLKVVWFCSNSNSRLNLLCWCWVAHRDRLYSNEVI